MTNRTCTKLILLLLLVAVLVFGCNQNAGNGESEAQQQEQKGIDDRENIGKGHTGIEQRDGTSEDDTSKNDTNKDNTNEEDLSKDAVKESDSRGDTSESIAENANGENGAEKNQTDGNVSEIDKPSGTQTPGEQADEDINSDIGEDKVDDETYKPTMQIDIAYIGNKGTYLDDGIGGWHDLDYIRNVYKFSEEGCIKYRLDPDGDHHSVIASGLFENDTFYFTKSVPDPMDFRVYNVYEYDLNTLKLKLLHEGLKNFYLMPLVAHPGQFAETNITDHRGIHYYNDAVYYIYFPAEASSSGIYRMAKGKPPVLLAKQPDLLTAKQADLIVKIDENGVYYVDFSWMLHRVSLDGKEQYKVMPFQMAANRLLIDGGHIFAYLRDVEGAGRDGLYYGDGKGNFERIVKGRTPKEESGFDSMNPLFVIDNWLYYEDYEGKFSTPNNKQLFKFHLQTGEKQVVIEDYTPYTHLGMLESNAYFLDKSDNLLHLDLQTNELTQVPLTVIDSPFSQQEIETRID